MFLSKSTKSLSAILNCKNKYSVALAKLFNDLTKNEEKSFKQRTFMLAVSRRSTFQSKF